MAGGKAQKGPELKTRRLTINYSIGANGSFKADLKSLIDADLPDGCRYVGISGWSANDTNILAVSIRYVSGPYGLELKNTANVNKSNQFDLFYIYI